MFKKVTAILLVAIMLLSMATCGKKDSDVQEADNTGTGSTGIEAEAPMGTSSMVIILGKHANMAYSDSYLDDLRANMKSFFEYYEENGVYYAQPQISLIVNDGRPEVETFSDEINAQLPVQSTQQDNLEYRVEKIIASINEYLHSDSIRATETQADLLKSVLVAKRVLDESGADNRYIYIIDNGISTSGYFDMRNKALDIQYNSVENIVKSIPADAIPDLTGVHVTFRGLGAVTHDQSLDADPGFADKLQNIWSAIFEHSHCELDPIIVASSKKDAEQLEWYSDGSGYPYVGFLVLKPVEPVYFTVLRSVKFIADDDEFVDEDDAITAITANADSWRAALSKDSSKKLYVVGSIAKPNPDDKYDKSDIANNRARKVKQILVDEGHISADQIEVINAGTHAFSWRTDETEELRKAGDDRDKKNAVQEPRRVVAIMLDSADEFNELKDAGYVS